MSTRNLASLFSPRAVALIGASDREGAVGAVIARNLLAGGFGGPVMLVNPRGVTIESVASVASIADLPADPELAVIATPPAPIPDLVAELGLRGCKACVIITAGLDAAQRQTLLNHARKHLMRIVGPNCLGFVSPVSGINASFAHLMPPRGDIAFLTQSGAIATAIVDWAKGRGIGFSHILSLGEMSDVDFGDLLDYLAHDSATRSILLYAETITHARKFMSAARIAARAKPVIVVKGGRSAAGAKAAASHTGALAGADAVYDAAFRRAGMLRVYSLRALFDAAETLASGQRPRGDRLMILTNGGGLGVLAADALDAGGGTLAALPDDAKAKLDAVLPPAWSHNNPIDILGDAQAERYENAIDILSEIPGWDALLVINCPTGVSDNRAAAEATIRARARRPHRPMLACWTGEATADAPRRLLFEAKLPNYETPDEAVRAFLHLVEYARNQEALLQAPAALAAHSMEEREAARAIVRAALADGRALLTEPEAKAVLAAYAIPVVETRVATSPEEAAQRAAELPAPYALKILSRDITHKSDVGGVRLSLDSPAAVEAAAREMFSRVAAAAPHARIDGLTVQPMVRRPHAQELILGAVEDSVFGPCLLFGQGGVATEIVADRALGLPPLNSVLAADMIRRTRVARLLAGYRDRAPADHAAIAATLVALSDLVINLPEIAELDINPLLADADGVIALDARIVVRAPPRDAAKRLAIRPYPAELEHPIDIAGARLMLRAIRPDDADAIIAFAGRTDPDHLRLRFHGAVGKITQRIAARLTQIDYDREMALVAVEEDGAIAGVGRLVFDPDFEACEYAIIVRSDIQHRGLGSALMREMFAYARARGAKRMWGDVLTENHGMLAVARELGADIAYLPEDHAITRTTFRLAP
ncbi:MAG: bifunctional acetate--CoA ligase family protein/GNAT family N-acetyltransferase [Hydrogenophilaceae bacterium]|jgi:acetyltransferase|nr:bifunctional acetate--CoA ligase family protein/GNAT family N-acetyltransferase [Hydrogenophilaceae bacterium]